MLLKSGAGPNLTTDDGQTPVHVACKYGIAPTLLLLLEDGGDPLFRNNSGETPLHLACRYELQLRAHYCNFFLLQGLQQ